MGEIDTQSWLLVWILTLLLNIVPAFMPPTWAVLTYFHVRQDMPLWPLAGAGATAATLGRALLAMGSRRVGLRLAPPRWRTNIETLGSTIRAHRVLSVPVLAMFTLNPVPSNHLCIAAGLAKAPLTPILTVFVVGRFVSYVLFVGAAGAAANSLTDLIGPETGVVAFATQILGIVMLMVVMRLDWNRILGRWRTNRDRLDGVRSPHDEGGHASPGSFCAGPESERNLTV